MDQWHRTFYKSPIGEIEIKGTDKEICSVNFVKGKKRESASSHSAALKECVKQLDEYFKGKRRIFELMLRMGGTDFQKAVWLSLLVVGYGETASYGNIAKAIGRPKAARAVGNSNRLNPIGIIVPCHRVIGSSGDLTGYGGGLWRKEWLLEHERKYLKKK
jgi:methylated-DNA-[protein]-cysteine S-methyltransferase